MVLEDEEEVKEEEEEVKEVEVEEEEEAEEAEEQPGTWRSSCMASPYCREAESTREETWGWRRDGVEGWSVWGGGWSVGG